MEVSLPHVPEKATVKEITLRTQNLLKCISKYRNTLVALSVASSDLQHAVKLICNPAFTNSFPSQRGNNPLNSYIDNSSSETIDMHKANPSTDSSNKYFTPPSTPEPFEKKQSEPDSIKSISVKTDVPKINEDISPMRSPSAQLSFYKPQHDYYTTLLVNLHDLALRIIHEAEIPISKGLDDYLGLISKWNELLSTEKKLHNQTKAAESRYVKLEGKIQKSSNPGTSKLANRDKAKLKWKELRKELNEFRFTNNTVISRDEAKFLSILSSGSSSLIKGTSISMGKIVKVAEMACISLGVSLPFQQYTGKESKLHLTPVKMDKGISEENKEKAFITKSEDGKHQKQQRRASLDSVLPHGSSFSAILPTKDIDNSTISSTSGIMGIFASDYEPAPLKNLDGKLEAVLSKPKSSKDLVSSNKLEEEVIEIYDFEEKENALKSALLRKAGIDDYSESKRAHFDTNNPIAIVHKDSNPSSIADLYPKLTAGWQSEVPNIVTLGEEPCVYVGDDAQSMMASILDMNDMDRRSILSGRSPSVSSRTSTVKDFTLGSLHELPEESHDSIRFSQLVNPYGKYSNKAVSVNINKNPAWTSRGTNNYRSVERNFMKLRERSTSTLNSPHSPVASSPTPHSASEAAHNSRSNSPSSARVTHGPRSLLPSEDYIKEEKLDKEDKSNEPKQSQLDNTKSPKLTKDVSSETSNSSGSNNNVRKYVCTNSFSARSGKELTILKGEMLIVKKQQSTWLYAIRKSKVDSIPDYAFGSKHDDGSNIVIKLPQAIESSTNTPKTIYNRVNGVITKKEMGWIPVAFVEEIKK